MLEPVGFPEVAWGGVGGREGGADVRKREGRGMVTHLGGLDAGCIRGGHFAVWHFGLGGWLLCVGRVDCCFVDDRFGFSVSESLLVELQLQGFDCLSQGRKEVVGSERFFMFELNS